jgi:MYXO-CTERM domain-containing protein
MIDLSRALRFSFVAALAALIPAMSPAAPAPESAPPAPAGQSAGPDSYGYKWIDNQGPEDPASGGAGPVYADIFQDISSSGTLISALNCDDCTTTIAPPMMVRYYGQNWGTAPAGSGAQVVSPSIVVSSNGNCQFLTSGQGANASYTNSALPGQGMNGMVAYMWDDCYGSGGGSCHWEVVGSAPNRRLIVQYTGWDWCCSDGPNMQYQVQFTESDGSADSTIYFVYSDITNADGRECGNSATIGIQSPNMQSYLQFSLNTASIVDGTVIRFFTNQSPADPTSLAQAADAGGPAKPLGFVSDETAYFRGTGTDPDASNTIGIEVEILPASQAFTAAVTGELATTPAGSLVAQGALAEAVYTFDGTPYGSGDYHWRARTIDNAGGRSGWVVFNNANTHFTVDLLPPTPPTGPFTPGDGDSVGVTPPAGDVLFRWGPAVDTGPAGPISYHFQLAASPGFAVPLADIVTPDLEARTSVAISNTPYFWRVSAIDQAGNESAPTLPMAFTALVDDDVNHGGGDCAISAGPGAGPLIPAALALLALAHAWRRRRR